MISLILSLIVLPAAFIALVAQRFGFRVLPTLAASLCAELLAVLLLKTYNGWQGNKLIIGESPEMVAQYAAHHGRIFGAMILIAYTLGLIIGLSVLFLHWAYGRMQAA